MDQKPLAPQVFRPNQPTAEDEEPNVAPVNPAEAPTTPEAELPVAAEPTEATDTSSGTAGDTPPIAESTPNDVPIPDNPETPSIEPEEPSSSFSQGQTQPEDTSATDADVPVAPGSAPSAGQSSQSETSPENPVAPAPETTQTSPVTPTPPATPPPASGQVAPGGKRRSWPTRIFAMLIAFVLLAAAAFAIYYYFFREKEQTKPHLKIGVMVAFTGGSSSMGYGEIKGVQLAKKQLGAENIEIIQEDSKCDPELAKQSIKRLIDQGVVAIIGDGCSSVSVEALPEANKAKVPMVSPSASSPALSIPNDYFFRVIPSDNFQGPFMAETIYNKGIRTVGMFYTNESYGNGISKVFKEKFEALGGKVVASVSADPDVIELEAQIAELKQANPQAIYFAPNSTLSATAAIKVAGEAGLDVPYFGADVLYDKTVISNVGTAAEELVMTSFPTGSKAFRQALYNEYQATDLLYAASQAYDAFHAIYLATQKGATTGEEIKNTLPSIEFKGVSAQIKFDQNGEISDPNYKYDLLTVKDGEIITVE